MKAILNKSQIIFSKWAWLFVLLWALFLSFEYFGYGANSYVKIHDNADVTLALKLAASSAEGKALWDPQQLGGTDRLTEVGQFDFINILFTIFPGWLAYGGLIFIQRFVAGYFTLRLLTEQLNVKPILALFPAFLYSMFPQNQMNLQFDGFTSYDSLGLPAVPAILFGLGILANRIEQNAKQVFIIAAFIGLIYSGFSFFAYSIFIFPLLALWLVLFLPRRHLIIIFLGFFAGWLWLESFELAASLNFSQFSQRAIRSYCTENVTLIETVWKTFDVQLINTFNIIPSVVGLVGILFWSGRPIYSDLIKMFLLTVLFILASALLPFFACSSLNPMEFFRSFNLSRFFLYIPFLIAIFSGVALQNVEEWLKKRKLSAGIGPRVLSGIVFVLLVIVFFKAIEIKTLTLEAREHGSNFADIFLNPYLEYLGEIATQYDQPVRAVLLFDEADNSMYNPGYLWPYGISTFDGYANLYPLRLAEYWREMLDPMMATFPDCRYGIRLLYGETRLYLSNGCEVGEEVDITRPSSLFNFNLLDLAGVRYVVSTTPVTDPILKEVDTNSISCPDWYLTCKHYFIYENVESLPFLMAHSEFISVPSENKAINRLGQTDSLSLSHKAIFISSDLQGLPINTLGPSPVQFILRNTSDDLITFDFSSKDSKLVIISSLYTKDWKVFIDGHESRLLPTNYIFKGIFVPAGDHLVELVYAPKYSMQYIAYWLRVYLNDK